MSTEILSETVENGAYRIGRSEIPINETNGNSFVPPAQFYLAAGDALERIAWAVSKNLPVLLVGRPASAKPSRCATSPT